MEAVSLLNGAVLSRLRRALRPITAVEKGVPVDAFVREVYRACLRDDARKGERGGWLQNPDKSHQLVESICHLFDLVDIDSLGVIKWEDFTDFCTDIGRRGAQEQQGRGRVPGEEDGGGLLDGIAGPNKFTVFVEKLGFVDRSSHCHEIGSLRFVKELQRLMVVEGGQQYLKVYVRGIKREVEIEPAITVQRTIIDEKGARYTRSKKQGRKGNTATVEGIPHRPHNVGRDNMAVLAAEFIGHVNQAVVSCADGNLSVWDLTTGKMLRYFPVRDVQVGLRYCPLMAVLISWGVDEYNNTILVWDIETFCTMHRLSGHTAAVRDVCEVFPSMGGESEDNGAKPSDNMLAGMDSKVIVWDLNLNSPERSRTPKQVSILLGHFHGVLSVAFSTEHDVIVTAGFDYEALCWDRSTRHLLQRLAGHRHSLIGVVIVRHETERAVTGDTGGNFRLWDIGGSRGSEQWGCLQTFSLSNPRAVRPRTMVVVWGEGLVVAGSKMHLFNAVRDVRPEETPAGAWFSTHTGQLCVLLGAVALFVDAATGDLATRMVLSGRSSSPGREITAVRLDACHKRIIVGEQGGGLQVYSGVNGRWVRSAHPHTAEVSDLLFVERDGTFVSVGWDRTIQIHDGRAHAAHVGGSGGWGGDNIDCPIRRSRTCRRGVRGASTRQCAVKGGKGVAATATERQVSGLAGVWRSVRHAHNADITALAFSAPLGLLATSSHDLTVRVWDYALLRLEEVIVGHLHEVSCLCFLDPLPFLATADTAGKVMLWTTRPHPNAWSLVLQIRNTHLRLVEDLGIGRGSGGERADHSEDTGEGGGVGRGPGVGLAGARSEPFPRRKVTPVSVATLAFLYNPMAGSSRDDCRQGKVSGGADPVAGCLRGRERICKYSLITGDDLGTVKVWDVTALLESKLSIRQDDPHLPPFPLEREQRSVPEEGVEPGKEMRHSGRAVHQPIHHREQPLDGVRPQTAFRLRTLIDIAEFLRKRGHLPPDPRERGERGDWTGGGGSKDTNRITERVNTVAVPRGKAGEITPFGVRGGETEAIKEDSPGNTSSAGLRTKLNSAGSSTGAERRPKGSSLPHDRSCVSSTRLRDTPATIMAQVDSAPLATVLGTEGSMHSLEDHAGKGGGNRQQTRRGSTELQTENASDLYAKVEAVLNAPVDEMEPLASWEAHGDSITSLQVIEDPPSVLTGSLDHSVRLFSLDGNPLGVVIQNGRLGNAPWKFVPPVPGRARVAEQKANELDETLKRVRREERWQQAFPDPAPYSTHPRVRSWRENVGLGGELASTPCRDKFRMSGDGFSSKEVGNSARVWDKAGVGWRNKSGSGEAEKSRISKAISQARGGRGDMGRCMPPPPSETSSRSFGSEQNGEAADKRLLEEIRGGENLDGNGTQPLRGIRDETAVCDGLGGLLGGAEAKKEQLREAWEAVSKTRYSCLGAEQERKRENRTRSTQSFLSEEISRVAGAQRPKTAARCGGRGGSTGEGKTPSGVGETGVPAGGQGVSSSPSLPGCVPSLALKLNNLARSPLKAETANGDMKVPPQVAIDREGRSGRSETSGHGRTLGSCASAPILVRCRPASSQPSDVRRRGSDGPTLTAVKDGGECPGREKTLTLTLTLRETRAPLLQRSTSKVSEMLSVPSARVTDRKESARPRTVSSGHRARIDRIIEDFRSIEGRSSGVSTTEPLLSPTRETPCHVGGGIGPVGWAGREGVQKNGMEGELRDGESEESSPKTPSKRLQGILTRFEQMVGDCREGDKCVQGLKANYTKFSKQSSGNVEAGAGRSSGASGGAGDTPGRSSKGGNDLHHSPTQQAAHKGDQRYRRARRYSLGTMNENLQRKQEAVVGLGGLSAGRFGPYGLDDVLEFRGFAAHFDMKGGVELVSVRTLMESAEEQEDMYTAALLKDLSKASVLRQHQTMPVEELMQLVFHFAKHEELQRISNAISIMSLLERLWEASELPVGDDRSLWSADGGGGLLSHSASCDIENTFRGMTRDACGTCTVRELPDMLSRAGWDITPGAHEELEVMAMHCGIEWYKELNASEFTTIISAFARGRPYQANRKTPAGASQ